jgi:hypothetical protein
MIFGWSGADMHSDNVGLDETCKIPGFVAHSLQALGKGLNSRI